MSAAPACPFCEAGATERVSRFGGQIITSQWHCLACGSYFEALRDDFDDAGGPRAGDAIDVDVDGYGSTGAGRPTQ